MKTIIAILVSIFCSQAVFAQDCPISFYDLESLIQEGRENALKEWAKQRSDESLPAFSYRMKKSEQQKLIFEDSLEQVFKERYISDLPDLEFEILEPYDEERQVFRSGISCFNDFSLFVPIEEAELFKSDESLKITHYDLERDYNEWTLRVVEIYSPLIGKTYKYQSGSILNYLDAETYGKMRELNPEDALAFEEPDDPMPDGIYDIHVNLPETSNINESGVAIIISNHDYTIAEDIKYAVQDGKAIKKYLINTLGYKEENIFMYKDLLRRDFASIFGSHNTHKGQLFNKTQSGDNDIFIYYSGHGVPGLDSKNAYFLPVNCDPSQGDLDGYPLDLLLENLAKIPAKSKTVIIDACFSGANIQGLSGVNKIGIRKNVSKYDDGKTIVMTSSEEDQYSIWYPAKEQSLFTYFFLKSIHDREKSDKNSDGVLTYKEVFEYVSDKRNGVPRSAGIIKVGLEQNPEVVLGERLLHKEFVTYK